jgi:hypothetical protein
MDSCALVEPASARSVGRPAAWTDERHALGWAEIAGLVDIFPDGSWAPTVKAIECIEAEGNAALAGVDRPSAFGLAGSCS